MTKLSKLQICGLLNYGATKELVEEAAAKKESTLELGSAIYGEEYIIELEYNENGYSIQNVYTK